MKRIISIAIILTGMGLLLNAQIYPDKYYVQFTDKNNSPYSINNPEDFLTQRSIDRRAAQNIPFDIKDLPVNPQYLQGVKDAGAAIINPTKWLNGVTIATSDTNVIDAIEALPYVASTYKSTVRPGSIVIEKPFFRNESYGVTPASNTGMKSVGLFDYGPSYNQIHMINGDHLHDVGYRGQGMLIGVLDAGFANADNLAVFDSLWDHNQIIATHDFVSGGPVTFDQHSHGTAVLSIMGGNYAGEIIGTAPKASYILMRTEDGPSEYIIEEYNWVSGAEFADSLGADILNTSLGYNEFYDTLQNHTYENMDGNTAPITIGADIAASRGIVVVNSAGNAGTWAWYYITAPADGDSVFSIGSVNAQGNPSGFSSHGPTYDGRIKPNVAAQGEGAYYALTGGGFQYGNGTSFSSPVMAGMMACLRQAHPEMNNMELINAVQESASIATAPDNKIGYGIPDFMAALTVVEVNADAISDIKLYPNPFSSSIEIAFYAENRTNSVISILDMTGRLVFEHQFMLNKGKNRLKLSSLDNIPAGIYFMRMEVDGTAVAMKIVKQ